MLKDADGYQGGSDASEKVADGRALWQAETGKRSDYYRNEGSTASTYPQ